MGKGKRVKVKKSKRRGSKGQGGKGCPGPTRGTVTRCDWSCHQVWQSAVDNGHRNAANLISWRTTVFLHGSCVVHLRISSRLQWIYINIPTQQFTWMPALCTCIREQAERQQRRFHQESGGGWRKDEARWLAEVSCFVFPSVLWHCRSGDTKDSPPAKVTCAT